MPDDQEIVGITERLVEQEPVTAATVSLSEQPVDTITNGIQSVQTLDKVQCVYLTSVEGKSCCFILDHKIYMYNPGQKSLVQVKNYRKHWHLSRTHRYSKPRPHPEFGNLNFGKKVWKAIKIDQKWSCGKDVLHVLHCFFKFLTNI